MFLPPFLQICAQLQGKLGSKHSFSQGRRKHLKLGGAQHFKSTFSLRKRGHFLKIRRALLCLLQNLGGVCAPVPPGSYVYGFSSECNVTFTKKLIYRIVPLLEGLVTDEYESNQWYHPPCDNLLGTLEQEVTFTNRPERGLRGQSIQFLGRSPKILRTLFLYSMKTIKTSKEQDS